MASSDTGRGGAGQQHPDRAGALVAQADGVFVRFFGSFRRRPLTPKPKSVNGLSDARQIENQVFDAFHLSL